MREDPELTLEALRTLLRMIEEKTRLLQLLDDYIDADGLTIVIGSEHSAPDLQRFSLVVSTYSDGRAVRRGRRHRADAHALLAGNQRRRLVVEGHQPDGQLETLTLVLRDGLPFAQHNTPWKTIRRIPPPTPRRREIRWRRLVRRSTT